MTEMGGTILVYRQKLKSISGRREMKLAANWRSRIVFQDKFSTAANFLWLS